MSRLEVVYPEIASPCCRGGTLFLIYIEAFAQLSAQSSLELKALDAASHGSPAPHWKTSVAPAVSLYGFTHFERCS